MSMPTGRKITLVPRSLTSADLPDPFWEIDLLKEQGYEAPDPARVKFQLSLDIGPVGSAAADTFQCIVVTEELKNTLRGNANIILMDTYSYGKFKENILSIIANCEADTWYGCIVNLRRYFSWEYEGMYSEAEIRRLNDR
ncbi:hypothetical protein EOS93_31070 [Rhizobium sp. RMa-01]|nr:hypothetical protein EOS93_31070 [Rhizobium sp. RMa-01]